MTLYRFFRDKAFKNQLFKLIQHDFELRVFKNNS